MKKNKADNRNIDGGKKKRERRERIELVDYS